MSKTVSWNGMTPATSFDKHRRGLLALIIYQGGDVNSKHPDKNARQDTALHVAARKGHVPGVRLLLRNGADPNILNGDGQRPIELTRNKQVKAL